MTLIEGFRDLRHERGETPFKRFAPVRAPKEHKLHNDRTAKYVFGVHYEIHTRYYTGHSHDSESRFDGVGEAATEPGIYCRECGWPCILESGECERCHLEDAGEERC